MKNDNALERYRLKHQLSYAALGRLAGKSRLDVSRHCKVDEVPKAAAVDYHAKLLIPMEELCPSAYTNESKS